MGSDNTPNFEVKNTKPRKRTKKKYKSKGSTTKTNNNTNIAENDKNVVKQVDEQNMKHRKRKERKQKSNNSNDSQMDTIKNIEEDIIGVKENQDEEESGDEATPPKKRANIQTVNNSDDGEDTAKSNAKTPKQPSKRQVKKGKAEKRENDKKMANKMEAITKGLNYVSKWKYARSEWKFEKLRQIWLIDNLLDETSIPDDIFPIVLEYFEGCKGMAREQLLKKGMDIVRKVEDDEESKDKEESVAYQRARKLLQALPTET